MDDWNHVSLELRNDHRKLYDKCRSLDGGGRVERIDRTGGAVGIDVRSDFWSGAAISYPTSFGMGERGLDPQSMAFRNTGNSFECEVTSGDIRAAYEMASLSGWRATLGDGAHGDVKRSELPVFDAIQINGSLERPAEGGPRFWAVAPIPSGGKRPTQLALAFLLAGGNATGTPDHGKEVRIEMVLLRGPTGGTGDPAAHIQSLLARPGSVLTNVLVTTQAGRKSVVESATEWIHPTEASMHDEVLIPTAFDTYSQCTELQVECWKFEAGVASCAIVLQHDLQEPGLPLASKRGDGHLKPDKLVSYRILVNERLDLSVGQWHRVKDIPLAPILAGTKDASTTDSCHVFARVIGN